MGSIFSYYYSESHARTSLSQNELSNSNNSNNSNISNNSKSCKFYILYIYLDESVGQPIKELYLEKSKKNNQLVDLYLKNLSRNGLGSGLDNGVDNGVDNGIDHGIDNGVGVGINDLEFCYDSGFDLFCPDNYKVARGDSIMLDHKIKCCMKVCSSDTDYGRYVGYYLYCRSSTGSRTPLRLANSVGIIDSGYRGNIKACFDCMGPMSTNNFNIEAGNRLTQICPPNLEHPMKVYIVDTISDLGLDTLRQTGGFGSTGK